MLFHRLAQSPLLSSRSLTAALLATLCTAAPAQIPGRTGRLAVPVAADPASKTSAKPDSEAPSLRLLAQADAPAPAPAPAPAAGDEAQPAPITPPGGGGPPGGGRPPFGGGSRRGGRGSFGGGTVGGGAPGIGGGVASGSDESDLMKIEGDKVSLQFPNNTITDILGIYERLTSKTLVKDTTIFEGQTISLVTPVPVDKDEAIKLIEASLLTNGYAIIADPNGKSARILPTRARDAASVQFSQGIHFYQSAADLPTTDTLVSFFMKLDHLDPATAAQLLGNHVGLNVYGRITPVATPPGLLITESAGIVRQLVSIKDVIDQPDTTKSVITKFIPVQYADAATVAQIIQATLDAQVQDIEQKGLSTIRGTAPVYQGRSGGGGGGPPGGGGSPAAAQVAPQAQAPGGAGKVGPNGQAIKAKAKSQVVADPRLNAILIVAEPDDYTYIISLIAEFDKPVEVEKPFERRLKNVYSVDVLSVLADLLKDTTKGSTQLPGGGTLNTAQSQPVVSSSSNLVSGRTGTQNQRGGSISANSAAAAASGTSSSAGSSVPDAIVEPQQNNAPISVLVNKTRIIADPLSNSIIIIGPKEDKDKVGMLLDRLDQKPPQAYLATVIGELTLDNEVDTGVDWLHHFSQIGSGTGGVASSFIAKRSDIITNNNVSDLRTNDITTPFGPTTGLNVYGQITSALDVIVSALETTNHFKVLSRPSVFVLNNRKATILSGQSVPVPTQSIANASSSSATSNGNVTTTIDYKDVVLKLEVIPLIDPDGELTLTIAQTNDTIVGTTTIAQNTGIPIVGTEKLSTTVTVPNGNTVVLGGLIAEQYKKDTSGIPYLSRIPGLGNLFKTNTTSKERKELVIFIQPRVALNDTVIRDASLHEDLRTRVGEDAAKTFPDKVIPVATPVVDPPKKKKKSFFGSLFNRNSDNTPPPNNGTGTKN